MMQNLKDQSIIGMKTSWHDKNNYYFLFDYAINGDFSQFLKKHGKLYKIINFKVNWVIYRIKISGLKWFLLYRLSRN